MSYRGRLGWFMLFYLSAVLFLAGIIIRVSLK